MRSAITVVVGALSENMQWLTIADAHAKDAWERKTCTR